MAHLQIYSPFGESTMNEVFRGFFEPSRNERNSPAPVRIDVAESDKDYIVHAEIPGVKKDEINVAIEGNQVTISADVKREWQPKDGEQVLRTERYFGNVYRSFTLPVELDEAASEARYENGVLELRLIKKPAATGRKLTIQ